MSLATDPDAAATPHAPVTTRPLPPLGDGGPPSPLSTAIQSFRTAVEALSANKLRSLLTMLGIIIGVGAVIVVIATGQGAAAAVREQLSRLGTNVVSVFPGSAQTRGVRTGEGGAVTLTEHDVQAIQRDVAHIDATTPLINGGAQVVANGNNWNTRVQAGYPDIQIINNYTTSEGAFFTNQDETDMAPVAVLGQTVVSNLFPRSNPVGQQIRIRNVIFRVVGVLTVKGNNGFFDPDDIILIPFSTAQRRLFASPNVGQIQLQVDTTQDIPEVIANVTQTLRQTHHLLAKKPNDFTVRNQQQFVNTAQQSTQTLTVLLTAVAGVSLVVGGIGIMNIMLVSVTERTREIGIRMAMGARAFDVLLQFLIEAVTLSTMGGIIGIVGGIGTSIAVTHVAGWRTLVAPGSIIVAFGFAAVIGVTFGFYPARRASQLDPIEALRHE